jgi:hypothetical protein
VSKPGRQQLLQHIMLAAAAGCQCCFPPCISAGYKCDQFFMLCHCPPPPPAPCRACSELDKMCEFFHIPFQSGDNDILREMKRGGQSAWQTAGWAFDVCTRHLHPYSCWWCCPARHQSLSSDTFVCLASHHNFLCRLHARAVPRDHQLHPAVHARRLCQRGRHCGVPRGDGGAV